MTDSANVALVRSIVAAHERGDYSATEWAHPEIEYVIADGPSPGSWRGLAGMAGAVREFLNAWDECRVEADEYRELDDQRVLVLTHRSGRGKASGLEVGQLWSRAADLFHVREGKITKLIVYLDRDRALADVGLEEQAVSENLDLVRSIFADWDRGDFSRADWAHPECEYVVVGGPEPGSWIGRAGMAEAMRGTLSAWEDYRIEATECRELDGERVLVFTRASGRGKTSKADLAQMRAQGTDVFHIRQGKVTRLVLFADRDRALADLGLAPQGEAP